MSSHLENVARVVSAEMVKAGVSKDVVTTAARHAAERIVAGEPGDPVVRELTAFYGGAGAVQAKPEPVKPASHEPPRDRRAAERIRVGTLAGNPWAAGSLNRTRQEMVTAADPALAARLRAEAGR